MALKVTLRKAVIADLSAVDGLLARSYPRLLKPDYPASVMVTALPIISRARPELLASGRYFLAVDANGALLGAGGYSLAQPTARGDRALGHIRHVASDPAATRQGVGRALMSVVLAAGWAEGVTTFDCLSTRTAVPFYVALGFNVLGEVDVSLAPGIHFPAVHMQRREI